MSRYGVRLSEQLIKMMISKAAAKKQQG